MGMAESDAQLAKEWISSAQMSLNIARRRESGAHLRTAKRDCHTLREEHKTSRTSHNDGLITTADMDTTSGFTSVPVIALHRSRGGWSHCERIPLHACLQQ